MGREPAWSLQDARHGRRPLRHDRALAPHGWWFPERDGSGDNPYGVLDSNVNLLLHNAPSVYGFGSDIRCTLCKIYKVKEGEM